MLELPDDDEEGSALPQMIEPPGLLLYTRIRTSPYF
jgi:hypothetical protein